MGEKSMIRISSIMVALMLQVGVIPAALAAGDTMTEPVTGMEFVRVPQGCFQPGNLHGTTASASTARKKSSAAAIRATAVQSAQIHEVDALDGPTDSPVAQPVFIDQAVGGQPAVDTSKLVCLKHDFWMARYEVTQGQYRKIMGVNPSAFKQGDDYPVERVRWLDVRKFIRRLNKLSGKHFRLPSEAEWEYAARSGGKNQRFGAAGSAAQVAWYMNNSGNSSHPVGKKRPNALGLYDMSGNVWEWTADCWNESLKNMPKDGSANKSGNCTARVLRGGSWYDAKSLITTTARLWNDTDKRDNNSGFRLVLD